MEDFIGKWITSENWNNGSKDLCKPIEIESGKFMFYERIYNGMYEKIYNTPINWDNRGKTRLALYEEYEQYLPNGHPDKKIIEQDYSYLKTLLNKLNIK